MSLVKIGCLTDPHFYTLVEPPTTYLQVFVDDMLSGDDDFIPDIVMSIGDTVVGNGWVEEYFIAFDALFDDINVPRYYTVGNHDCDSALLTASDTVKGYWYNLANSAMNGIMSDGLCYYSFDVNSALHIVVLDSICDLDGSIASNYNYWYVGTDQLTWLANDLANSSYPTIIFCHVPLDGTDGDRVGSTVNADDTRSIIENNGDVIAVFTGHTHSDKYKVVNGIPYWQLMSFRYPHSIGSLPGSAYSKIIVDTESKKVQIIGKNTEDLYWPQLNYGGEGMPGISSINGMTVYGKIDSGETLPASPSEHDLYMHTPYGRRVLMLYENSVWTPIQGFGALSYYVDPSGTDNPDYGFGTTTDAYATLPYLVSQLPQSYDSTITIYLSAHEYDLVSVLTLLDCRKNVTISGTWGSAVISGTAESGVRGATTVLGSVTDTGAFSVTASTTATGSSNNAGDTSIDVTSSSGFTAGGIIVCDPGGAAEEQHIVKNVETGIIHIEGKLANDLNSSQVITQGAHSGYWIKFASDTTTVALRDVYRPILWNTADVVTIATYFPEQPQSGDTYTIVTPGTVIDGGASYYTKIIGSENITISRVEFKNTLASTQALLIYRSYVSFFSCRFRGGLNAYDQSLVGLSYCVVDGNSKASAQLIPVGNASDVIATGCLLLGPAMYGLLGLNPCRISLGGPSTIIGCRTGIYCINNAVCTCGNYYNHIKDCLSYGCRSFYGGMIYTVSHHVYAGNGANESADAASFSCIGL